ncbi:transcriptional repressor LexA [uncultured Eubacterium sp.]|uniref:transcriptional repressor LexA n=1 Tax=uncultured Eubacterium sp. TaxID=165185 RepID=UPI0028043F2B|nr:transcriptional repressor LexA [uncultured Eubacterium sp.]
MKKMDLKQKQCLEFIKEYFDERGVAPTVREIETAMDYHSPSSAQYMLNTLEKAGYIERDPLMKRTVRIKGFDTKAYHVPLVGTVTAGQPILAVESIEDYIPVPVKNKGKNMFALKVRGDSMINAGILNGDTVIVEQTPVASNGEIVVALIGDEATVKRFYKEKGHFRLQPENDVYEPIIVAEVSILGKVNMVIRKY